MDVDDRFVRSDVWLIDFGHHPADPEQAFRRPAVIVSDDRLHHPKLKMVLVVPGTSTIRDIALHHVVHPDARNGLVAPTAFQLEKVRAVSSIRLFERLGELGATDTAAIDEILRYALRL